MTVDDSPLSRRLSRALGDRSNKAAKEELKTLTDEQLEALAGHVHRFAYRRECSAVSAELKRRNK